MQGKRTPEERSALLEQADIGALNRHIEETYRWAASSYLSADLLLALAFLLAVITGWPWFLLLLIPAAIIIFTTEVVVEDMHDHMLRYLERCGIDVSEAPKPLFARLRARLRRLRR